jgi:myo-inositol-1(or 4)-monophosphatase
MPHSAILNVMVKAAYRAGRSLKRDLGEVENLQVSLKGPRNFVTAADRRAEDIVREELAKARPDYGFLGEEGGARAGADKSHRWIVDPLDGTTNFLHGIPHFAVSIALERNGAIVAALTYNPANDELYVAERGKGAFLNDRRIRVAARQRLADAVVACGLPHHGRGDLALGRHEIAAAQQNYAGLRRFGAATLDLAWVAAGRFDAFWERDLSPWDMAAGILLVREAGGFVSDLDGGDAILSKGSIAAGNDTMHRELLRLMKEAGKAAAKDSSRDQSEDADPGATKDGPDVVAASPAGRQRR